MLNFITDVFQNPAKKHGIAVLLKGQEGTGKNRTTDLLRVMMGRDKFLQTASPANTLYGRFTRLLIVINESNGAENFAASDVIKDMITCDEFQSEGKGTNAYTMSCFARFMFTTNNDNCLRVNPDSRRFFVVEVSSELKGDTDYF
jgi:predicted P-loop ATPase